MPDPKKLIEVAMPVKEISAESVRDKSIRHGHISTLHLWWARRPLPVCRAVVFASLVPDPMDENCQKAFKEAVELLLGKDSNPGDPYKPYEDIPYTAAHDKMDDNLRNRLLMFIGKFSDKYAENEKNGKKTDAKDLLSNFSLIKWDNKNNNEIIGKARRLIWVSHNSVNGDTAKELLEEYNKHYKAIKDAENELYSTSDRHINSKEIKDKEKNLQQAIDAFLDKMPKVFDPFAGGGAIPLEAARLGCKTYANDINPVAHIIQKGSIEFPQKYGKPITYSKDEFVKLYGEDEFNKVEKENLEFSNGNITAVKIGNRLAFDVEYYAKKLLEITSKDVGYLYPNDEIGDKPIAYYWARVATCSNPSCKAEIPMLKQFYICNRGDKQIYLEPIIEGNKILFELKEGTTDRSPWNNRGNILCPVCNNITDIKLVKQQSKKNELKDRLLTVIYETDKGKVYRKPREDELNIFEQINTNIEYPNEQMQRNSAGGDTFGWGINKWGQLFSPRQITTLYSFINSLALLKKDYFDTSNEYDKSIISYLAIILDRVAARMTTFGLWHDGRETVDSLFARQAISMISDYPESNPFCNSSGSYLNQLDWVLRYCNSESSSEFYTICKNAESGDKNQFPNKFLTSVITDPPYYDSIAYADISDFFYIWLKRTLSDIYPLNFATPQTPKSEECTALKHHHDGDLEKAKKHFETTLLNIFKSIELETSNTISIMFAHQSTEAWSTLCNSILGANMNITGSWALDTEYTGTGLKSKKSFLSSSVTVSCKPWIKRDTIEYKTVKKNVISKVKYEVNNLYKLGFRGVDLLTACFGQAVSEFGKYEKVEKADGSNVNVSDLLLLAREAAFEALIKGFETDDYTRFYLGWLQIYGFVETEYDELILLVKMSLSIETKALFDEQLLHKNGSKQTLSNFSERMELNNHLGEHDNSNSIDKAHRALHLYKTGNRTALLAYISKHGLSTESTFWRLMNSLVEILPQASEDYKQARGLLDNKDSLLREAKASKQPEIEQEKLFN